MAFVIISDFGKDKKGVHTWRINSHDKNDLMDIIRDAIKSGYIFKEEPRIRRTRHSWSVLLRMLIPNDVI